MGEATGDGPREGPRDATAAGGPTPGITRAARGPRPGPLKCPVCGARFRGSVACSRCGSDLAPLMRIAAKAWAARERSREALRAGDWAGASRWAAAARLLQRPPPAGE